jgi:hypothetical protein
MHSDPDSLFVLIKEKRIMSDLSPHSIPLPERGWTRERMAQFLDYLSENGNVRAACKRVGLSREAAYRLRRRNPEFARGWAAALVLAHDAGVEVLGDRAIDGIEEDVWHRGELVGTRRKYDTRLLLAHLARLDKAAEDAAAQRDAGRFDELLACIAGEMVPPDLLSEDDILPLDREEAVREAAAQAEKAVRHAQPEEGEDGEAAALDPEAEEQACVEAFRRGRLEGAAQWDLWFDDACGYVDWLSGWDDGVRVEPMSPGPEGEEAIDAVFESRTVSDVSSRSDPAGGPSQPVLRDEPSACGFGLSSGRTDSEEEANSPSRSS